MRGTWYANSNEYNPAVKLINNAVEVENNKHYSEGAPQMMFTDGLTGSTVIMYIGCQCACV